MYVKKLGGGNFCRTFVKKNFVFDTFVKHKSVKFVYNSLIYKQQTESLFCNS